MTTDSLTDLEPMDEVEVADRAVTLIAGAIFKSRVEDSIHDYDFEQRLWMSAQAGRDSYKVFQALHDSGYKIVLAEIAEIAEELVE